MPRVMSGAVLATLKLHPDTRLSNGSAAQLMAGLALDPNAPSSGPFPESLA
jgi:hypothetical protein